MTWAQLNAILRKRHRSREIQAYEVFDDFRECCKYLGLNFYHSVYADGACRHNGSEKAYGGIGVYHGRGDPRNFGRAILEQPTTNQFCELTAIEAALGQAIGEFRRRRYNRPIRLRTDSQYAVNCLTKWCYKWEDNGWYTSKGYPVAHAELIQKILRMLDHIDNTYARRGYDAQVRITHVPGHSGNRGNEAADELANEGADLAFDYFWGSSSEYYSSDNSYYYSSDY
ncbi:hypothetical protein TRVA0_030S01376 [Trichomonascus vanleenenianus]|uniref:ribonuclease H family protein n=1 Tax=Trichomonascus vanleenenianus TaxID=2268995 RepID=UPI003ECA9136